MKKLLITLLLVLLPSVAFANESEKDWTVQIDPLTTALGFVHVQFERTLGDHFSVYLGPHMRLFSSPFADEEDFLGFGAELGVRWYFLGTAPEGFWGLVRGVGAHLSTSANGTEETAFGGYGSVLAGYTWILGDIWVLSAGAGGQYLHYTVDGLGPKTFAPALHTALGVAF